MFSISRSKPCAKSWFLLHFQTVELYSRILVFDKLENDGLRLAARDRGIRNFRLFHRSSERVPYNHRLHAVFPGFPENQIVNPL